MRDKQTLLRQTHTPFCTHKHLTIHTGIAVSDPSLLWMEQNSQFKKYLLDYLDTARWTHESWRPKYILNALASHGVTAAHEIRERINKNPCMSVPLLKPLQSDNLKVFLEKVIIICHFSHRLSLQF